MYPSNSRQCTFLFARLYRSLKNISILSILGLSALSAGNAIAAQPNTLKTCSTAWSSTANLKIHNNHSQKVDLYWVDYQCNEVKYTTINPGYTVVQPSFITHPWRIRESGSGKLLKQVTLNKAGTTVVGAKDECSAGGSDAVQLEIYNNDSSAVEVYWMDYNCKERYYYRVYPGKKQTINTYATHVWRIRKPNSGIVLKDIQLDSSASTRVNVVQRNYADNINDTSFYQIHPVYVLPSDRVDEKLDLNGSIAASMAAARKWMRQRAGGQSIKYDTYQGGMDISFVRLNKTDAQMIQQAIQNYGSVAFLREVIESELHARGFNNNGTVYVAYYGGSTTWACGGAPLPPDGPQGNVVALYLWGAVPGAIPCHDNPFAKDENSAGYWEWSILHEVFHGLGAVPNPGSPNTPSYCAPNATGNGHTSDMPTDLMYAGTLAWRPDVIDFGNDDYFNINNTGCTDIAKSVFLRPADAAALAPPGWQ